MVEYISHTIWRFIKYKPNEYRLLDARYNIMKSLILGDCDHLIKFILFGDEDDSNLKEVLHIPRSVLWKNRNLVNRDDLKPFEKEDDKDWIIPTNDMELAIYYCKGKIFICL